ncbi:MAG: biopolymer transporter ExbD [Nitrospinae bacterium]|nr:biopolymer transporter ExbD [Nitrospinota bacterium]
MRRRRRPEFHIEIAPVNLIDLVLILLIFFITTTTFLNLKLIEMTFPEAASASAPEQGKRKTVINIDEHGTLFLDERKVTLQELESAVQNLPQDAEVLIGADQNCRHGDFMGVIDVLKGRDINNIDIVTRPKHAGN